MNKKTLIMTGILSLSLTGAILIADEAKNSAANIVAVERHASFPAFSTEKVKVKSVLIVKGKPVRESVFSNDLESPFTEYTFQISNVYKGDKALKNTSISVLQDGIQGDFYAEHPLMRLNTEYVLFLEEPVEGKYIMTGGPSGKYEVDKSNGSFKSITKNEINATEFSILTK
ncbi:hypothetical protein B1748_31115 [Paenibacillus sp. MY03]|jgi:hypothetical protein|uniref:hypothetical protein n=1 Tax=Paenibacillus sp. MY03 TaxID=302980 RepID=UPI000B3C719E|nr:hypothetical protein [Paenibacillus sp. MY03]OUS69616.1 hypothetical protein B1748_31115 [Paenibacillus sp. MY03]